MKKIALLVLAFCILIPAVSVYAYVTYGRSTYAPNRSYWHTHHRRYPVVQQRCVIVYVQRPYRTRVCHYYYGRRVCRYYTRYKHYPRRVCHSYHVYRYR